MTPQAVPRTSPRLAVIAVGWDEAGFAAAIRAIAEWMRMTGVEAVARVAVLNSPEIVPPDDHLCIAGSNLGLDLGGYAEGLLALDRAGIDADLILFANDRLTVYEDARPVLGRIRSEHLGSIASESVVAGQVWAWRPPRPRARPWFWVQTHCFFASWSAIELVDAANLLRVHGAGSVALRRGRPLVADDRDATEFLEDWAARYPFHLRSGPHERGVAAASRDDSFIIGKAETVLREAQLSAALLAGGGRLVGADSFDAGWVARRCFQVGAGRVVTTAHRTAPWPRRVLGRLKNIIGLGLTLAVGRRLARRTD